MPLSLPPLRRPALLIAALAWACGDGRPGPEGAPKTRPPLPGLSTLRMSQTSATASERFPAAHPWELELQVGAGLTLTGRGLPPDLLSPGALAASYDLADMRSIVEIELPVSAGASADEDQDDGRSFDAPRLCKLGSATCLWADDDDGRWRAWRIRPGPSGDEELEVQLASAWTDTADLRPAPTPRVITVWLDAGETLTTGDRLRFTYVGHMPGRSTAWLEGDSAVLRPRLRYWSGGPPDSADTTVDCPGYPDDCWVVLPPTEIDGLTLHPGPTTFLRLQGPLDARPDTYVKVQVVGLDTAANPTPLTTNVRIFIDGVARGPVLRPDGSWSRTADLGKLSVGRHFIRASVNDASIRSIGQWITVREQERGAWVRLLGDLHIHTGGLADHPFYLSSSAGDHRGDFTRADDALRYLREVSGHDFGALSEHSTGWPGYAPPPGDPAFGPGGPCEVLVPPTADAYDWWTASQQIAWSFQTRHPDFTTFPAYEWHGHLSTATEHSPLHRVVLFKDHDPVAWSHPALPGNQRDRLPQCLLRWLDTHGYDGTTATVIPHMMTAEADNTDWSLSYAPDAAAAALASAERTAEYQRVGEIFSTRNYRYRAGPHAWLLTTFEGRWTDDPTDQPFTWRYGWRDVAARVGIIGSGDNHDQSPGADDPWSAAGPVPPGHGPTGTAVVLVDPAIPRREAIFEAIRARRTYATTGIRAWLSWEVTLDGQPHPMGSSLGPTTACALTANVDLAAPASIRAVEIWATQAGGAQPWHTARRWEAVNRGSFRNRVDLDNPVPVGGPGQTWLYYVRAFTGEPVLPGATVDQVQQNHADAVWSSPIWIDWREGGGCP